MLNEQTGIIETNNDDVLTIYLQPICAVGRVEHQNLNQAGNGRLVSFLIFISMVDVVVHLTFIQQNLHQNWRNVT